METLLQLLFYLEYVFWFILVFSIIVFIHEFGHFYIAKVNKVKVDRFSIGFGPSLLKFKDSDETIWQVCLIPLGGYVKFSGEMYPEQNTKNHSKKNSKLFMNKTAVQKASIVLAGPIANFVLGIILFIIIFIFYGKNYTSPIVGYIENNSPADVGGLRKFDKILTMNNEKINSFEDIYNILDDKVYENILLKVEREDDILDINIYPEKKIIETFIGSKREINYVGMQPIFVPIIKKVLDGTPAFKSGLRASDEIKEIDGKKVFSTSDVIAIIEKNPNNKLNFLVARNNKKINLIITPEPVKITDEKEKGVIGIQFSRERKKLDFFAAIYESIDNVRVIIVKTLIAFSEILFGKRDHCEVGGPILIAKVSNDIGSQDLVSFMSLIALISINLGLINLFPLPLLDGGHFFTYLYEIVNNKRVTKTFYKYFQIVGAVLIISLMTFSVLNDLYCRVLN